VGFHFSPVGPCSLDIFRLTFVLCYFLKKTGWSWLCTLRYLRAMISFGCATLRPAADNCVCGSGSWNYVDASQRLSQPSLLGFLEFRSQAFI
jgi:hypothetical protein